MSAAAPSTAWAQGAGDAPLPAHLRRPYRGIFGGPVDPEAPHTLTLTASAYGAYDDNLSVALDEQDNVEFDARLTRSGWYGAARAGLLYQTHREGERVSFGGVAGAQANYYGVSESSTLVPFYHAGGNLRVLVMRSPDLVARQSVTLARNYSFVLQPILDGVDPDAAPFIVQPELELFPRTTLRSATGLSLLHRVGRRSSIHAGYAFDYVDFLDDPDLSDYYGQSASAGFQTRLTTYSNLDLGYRFRIRQGRSDATQPEDSTQKFHDIIVGVSYARALSFSRRTSISFSTGSTLSAGERLDVPESELESHFRFTGSAALTHELGRTWTAQVGYHRGFVYYEDFNDTYFTEAVRGGIGGLVTRRLDTSTGVVWVLTSEDSRGGNAPRGLTGSAQARYALSRFLALFATYVYYEHDLRGAEPLDPQVPQLVDRQGFRAGITATVPLIR
jgi:hypothetical protein